MCVCVCSQMNSIMEECEASTDVLQSQVDEARERTQRELDELRRQLQDKGAELEKSRQAASKLQEEVRRSFPPAARLFLSQLLKHTLALGVSLPSSDLRAAGLTSRSSCFLSYVQLLPLEEDLRQRQREQQEAQQRCRQLEKRVEELEERNTSALGERERHAKLLEARVSGTDGTLLCVFSVTRLSFLRHNRFSFFSLVKKVKRPSKAYVGSRSGSLRGEKQEDTNKHRHPRGRASAAAQRRAAGRHLSRHCLFF